MKEMTKEERDAVLKDIPIHKEVPHPEGVDISEDEANFAWINQSMLEKQARLERSASPAAPWSEEELDERSTLNSEFPRGDENNACN